jgi:hypothetical protein
MVRSPLDRASRSAVTRDELNEMLATRPATPNQRGAVLREFGRLGFHDEHDRAERLAICAALLGLEELGSTRDLVMGQAGQLVNILQRVRDRGELAAVELSPRASAADEHQDDEAVGERITVVAAVKGIIFLVAMRLNMGRRLQDSEDRPGDPAGRDAADNITPGRAHDGETHEQDKGPQADHLEHKRVCVGGFKGYDLYRGPNFGWQFASARLYDRP